jgi:hypothetical protein
MSQGSEDGAEWVCVLRPPRSTIATAADGLVERLASLVRRGVERRWKWYPTGQPAKGTPPHAQVLLLEYRVLWYTLLDGAVLLAVAALSVVSGLDPGNLALCRGCTGLVVALLAVQLAVCLATQPFTSLISHVASVLSIALTILSVVAQLIVASSTNASLLWLVDASLCCVLGVAAAAACKMVVDAFDLVVGVRRRWALLLSQQRHDGDDYATELQLFVVTNDASFKCEDKCEDSLITDNEEDDVLGGAHHDDDAMNDEMFTAVEAQFWNAAGTAVGTAETSEETKLMLPSDVDLQRARSARWTM